MSWAVEEWKDGLPGKALQKIQEIESQLDKLKKERQQKQFQLDSLEAALQKQKQKIDVEKNETAVLKRENQSLVESCETLEKSRQKVNHELQVKEQQVNYLEGQLSGSKKQIERLEQELKRYKNELDKSQPSHSLDPQTCTPQKTFVPPATPCYRQPDSRSDDLQEKYNKEVEERKRLESELKVMQVKLLNHSSVSHKDIARHQTQSSIFPWQQDQTPGCPVDTPLKRRTGASGFLWDAEETPLKGNPRISSAFQSDLVNGQTVELLKSTNQDLKGKVSELELRLQAHDKEMKNQLNKFNEIQSQLDKAKKELIEKDRTLNKSRDELAKVTGQHEQAVAKCSSMEQKLKQVTEEMNCQRHNADSLRRALEQKMKDQEKEAQKELARQQNTQLSLEQQLNQVKAKMSQELHQAKKDYNFLQSDLDKTTAQKSHLEKDLEEQKRKLCCVEQELQASHAKEQEFRKKFEEMQREKNTLSNQSAQDSKKLSEVEEELNSAKQNLKRSSDLMEDLKIKANAQNDELNALRIKLENNERSSSNELECLRKLLDKVQVKKEECDKALQKHRKEMEEITNKNVVLEKEQQDLLLSLNSKQDEFKKLQMEAELLQKWKNEKENLIDSIDEERESMQNKVAELEKNIDMLKDSQKDVNEIVRNLEDERDSLVSQMDALKGQLLNKCMEFEEKEQAYHNLKEQLKEIEEKHVKDLENTATKITLLKGQLSELETRLHQETTRAERMQESHNELLAQYESACNLALSKDSVIELKQNEITQLQDSLAQIYAEQGQLMGRFTEERSSLMKQCEKDLCDKTEEVEQAVLKFEQSQQEVLFLKDQVASLDSAVKLQKSLNVELQKSYESLCNVKDDLQEKMSEVEKNNEVMIQKLNTLSQQVQTTFSLTEQLNVVSAEAKESKSALQCLSELLKQKVEELKVLHENEEDLKSQLNKADIRAFEQESLNAQLGEKIMLLEKDIKEITAKHKALREVNDELNKEKSNLVKEKSEAVVVSEALKQELESSSHLSAELKNINEELQGKYTSSTEINFKLESTLNDYENQMITWEKELKALEEKNREMNEVEIENYKKNVKSLTEELELTKTKLENKIVEVTQAEMKLADMETELSRLQIGIEAANSKVNEINLTCEKLSSEKEFCTQSALLNQNEIKMLKTALTSAEEAFNDKQCENQSLKKKLCDAKLEHSKATDLLKEKDLTMNKIKVQLELLQMDLEDNETFINSFDSEKEKLEATILGLETKLQERDLQISALNDETSRTEELALKEQEILQIKACLDEANRHKESFAVENDSLKSSNLQLQISFEEETQRCSNLETNYRELKEEKTKLHMKFDDLQNSFLHLQQERDRLKNLTDGLKKMLQNQKEENDALLVQNEKINVANEQFTIQHKELHEKFVQLQVEHDTVTINYTNLMSKVSAQQAIIEQFSNHEETDSQKVYKRRSSSFVNVSLPNEDCLVLEHTFDGTKCDVLHSSAIEEPGKEHCVSPCEDVTLALLFSSCEGSLTYENEVLNSSHSNVQPLLNNPNSSITDEQSHSFLPGPIVLEEEPGQRSTTPKKVFHDFEEVVRSIDGPEPQISILQVAELKSSLCSLQKVVQQLKKQHCAEVQVLKQKLLNLGFEMEAKLAAEKKQTEILSSELEAARLQMQGLDLGSQSLLSADTDNMLQTITEAEVPGAIISDTKQVAEASDAMVECHKQSNENEEKQLQKELQVVKMELELCNYELVSKKDMFSEMEHKLQEMHEQQTYGAEKLNSALQEKQILIEEVSKLKEELCSLRLQLQTSNCQLADVMEMMENLEVAKGSWDDKFFQLENDLKRIQSEKANLERHILSMETDFDVMHTEKEKVLQDLEECRKASAHLEQNLAMLTNERQELKQDIFSINELREKESESLLSWKEKAMHLEKDRNDARELIKILEEDIINQKREYEIVTGNITQKENEKNDLFQQFQVLEKTVSLLHCEKDDIMKQLVQFKEEQNEMCRNDDANVSKIHTLTAENSRLLHSLESSLMEKTVIASRLNSTQDEVAQLKSGIEKLRVKIEADERKKQNTNELLKVTQRKVDALQDSMEKLDREKEMTEQSLEDAIVQAESTKAELETLVAEKMDLSNQLKLLTSEQLKIQDEREMLETELQKKTEEIKTLEREIKGLHVNAVVVEELKIKVSTLVGQLTTCQNELESAQLKEQDLTCQLSSLKEEVVQLSERLELQSEVLAEKTFLVEDLEVKLREGLEDSGVLKQKVTELETFKDRLEEKLVLLESKKEDLEKEKELLQLVAADMEQKAKVESALNTALEADNQQKELLLEAARFEHAELNEKVIMLNEHNGKLQNDLSEALTSKDAMHEAIQQQQRILQQAESYKLSLDILTSEKEGFIKNLECTQECLAHEVTARKGVEQELLQQTEKHNIEVQALKKELAETNAKISNYLTEIDSLNSSKEQLQSAMRDVNNRLDESVKSQVNDLTCKVNQLTKEKELALSKLNLWMKSCKQLEMENQTLLEEHEQQKALLENQRQGDLNSGSEALHTQIEQLKEALEERSKEADDSMDKYCSLLVNLHKLEESNETLQNQVAQLTRQLESAQSKTSLVCVTQKVLEKSKSKEPQEEQGPSQVPGKRQRGLENTPIKAQEALHNTAKRIRAGSTPQTACLLQDQQADDFKPEGLPDLVKRGFADIPVGENSPFIMRRTTVRRCSPRLAAKKSPISQQDASVHNVSAVDTRMPPEGSQRLAGHTSVKRGCATLLPLTNSPRRLQSPVAEKAKQTPEQRGKGNVSMGSQDENCHIQ